MASTDMNLNPFSTRHYCPLYAGQRDWFGRRLSMAKTCPTCPWATNVVGKHPADKTDVDQWGCGVPHNVMLQVESIGLYRSIRETLDRKLNELARLTAQGVAENRQHHKETQRQHEDSVYSTTTQPPLRIQQNGGAQLDLLRDTEIAQEIDG